MQGDDLDDMDRETGFSFLALEVLLSSNEVDVIDINGEVEDEDEQDNDEDNDDEEENITSLDFELFGHFIFKSGLLVVSNLLSSGEEEDEEEDEEEEEDGISILSRSFIRFVEFVAVGLSSTVTELSLSSLFFSSAVSSIVIVVKRLSGFLTTVLLFNKS